MKTCMVCDQPFEPFQPMQRVCGLKCAKRVPVIARNTLKNERKATKKRLTELLPLSHWQRLAQAAFNAWIRFRDFDQPCISCGTRTAVQWQAGHYLSRGARPELRFDEQNCHKQCSQCNDFLSGNLVPYGDNLVKRIGQEAVDRLKTHPQKAPRLRRQELQAIAADYRERLKTLKRNMPERVEVYAEHPAANDEPDGWEDEEYGIWRGEP